MAAHMMIRLPFWVLDGLQVVFVCACLRASLREARRYLLFRFGISGENNKITRENLNKGTTMTRTDDYEDDVSQLSRQFLMLFIGQGGEALLVVC